MKFVFAFLAVCFMSLSAQAAKPQLIKKTFQCSVLADYNVYIQKISGITNSYKVAAFCLDSNDDGLEACLQDEDDDTYTCFDEFNSLNPLGAGDGELVIVHGR